MPRPRKYDYQKDYPVRIATYLKLPAEAVNHLDEMGYSGGKELSKLVEKLLLEFVENNKIKSD